MKGLPRDESGNILKSFKLAGMKFRRLNPDEEFGIIRYNAYRLLSFGVTYGMSPVDYIKRLDEVIETMLGEGSKGDRFGQSVLKLMNLRQAVADFNDYKHDCSLDMLSLFCITEDEDPAGIKASLMEEKAKAFKESGIPQSEVFFCAVSSIPGLTDILSQGLDKGESLKSHSIDSTK